MSTGHLLSIPPSAWTTESAICLGWQDGPTDVVLHLAHPDAVLHAELVAERATEDDLDERLFRATLLPRALFDRLSDALAPIGPALRPVWIPLWRFPTEEARLRAEEAVAAIRGEGPPDLLLFTDDMKRFRGAWPLSAAAGLEGYALFQHLGL